MVQGFGAEIKVKVKVKGLELSLVNIGPWFWVPGFTDECFP